MRTHSETQSKLFRERGFIDAKNVGHESVSEKNNSAIEPAVAILNKQGVVNFIPSAIEKIFNCTKEQIEGVEASSLFPELPFKKSTPGYNLAFAKFWGNEAAKLELEGHSPNGHRIPLEVSLRLLNMDTGPIILLGISPLNGAHHPNGELNNLIKSAKFNSDAVIITDTQGVIKFANVAFEESSGYRKNEVVGQHINNVKTCFQDEKLYKSISATLLSGNDFRTVVANCRKNGDIFHEDLHLRPFIDGNSTTTYFVITSRGLSEPLRTTLQRLQREAYHDALTGLPNRNLFLDRLKHSFSTAARRDEGFCLVYLDLDNFKEINDTYGHAAGDAVLRATAKCLRASIRNEDTVARLGGDEFALILLGIRQREDIEPVFNKILLSLANGTIFENTRIPIQGSIGASIYPENGDDCETLLKLADSAMYSAKHNGGHGFHFYADGDEDLHKKAHPKANTQKFKTRKSKEQA